MSFVATPTCRAGSEIAFHFGCRGYREYRETDPEVTRGKDTRPAGFIRPCQPALADRPPAGLGLLHEVKWDGYRVIARKDGERVNRQCPGRLRGAPLGARSTVSPRHDASEDAGI